MRKLLIILTLILFPLGIRAQDSEFSQLKKDYNLVNIVAHVEIKSIKFAAPDVYPLYVIQSEIIEPFKGKIKRGQWLEFYYHIEDGENRDLSGYINRKAIVFLQGKYPIPKGGKGWYQLENSDRQPTKKAISWMRNIKRSRKKK